MLRSLLLIALIAAVAGCSSTGDRPGRAITEAQRDSLIGASDLPGAGVVRRALDESGRQQTRAAHVDSLFR